MQCRLLHDRIFGGGLRRKPDPAMAALRKCKLVVVSPLLRALQTAGLVFGRPAGTDDGPDDGPEVVVWPNLSEQVTGGRHIADGPVPLHPLTGAPDPIPAHAPIHPHLHPRPPTHPLTHDMVCTVYPKRF